MSDNQDPNEIDTVAADIVSTNVAGININTLRAKQIGMSVVLLNLAVRESERISRVSRILSKLEDDIFDEETLDRLSDADKVERFKLANNIIGNSLNYINAVNRDISLDELQTKVDLLSRLEELDPTSLENNSNNTTDISEMALRVLQQYKSSDTKK